MPFDLPILIIQGGGAAISRLPEVAHMSQKQSNRQAVVVPFEDRSNPSGRRSARLPLERHLAMARQTGRRLGVFCIRIDRHADRRGDIEQSSLDKLRRRLHEFLPSTVTAGGSWRDGLIIVHMSTDDAFGMYRRARALLTDLERALCRSDAGSAVKLSLGAALHPVDGTQPSVLLDHAHAAAIRAGGWDDSGLCFASPSTGREIAERLTMDVALRHALEAGDVDMRFQPVLDLGRPCLTAVHAEPVWRHPERGEIRGEETLATLERAGLSKAYNAWLVKELCRQGEAWVKKFPGRRFVVSITRSQLVDAPLAASLSKALDAHGVPADLFEVTVDGKLLIDGTDHRLRTGLRQLTDLGVRLTIANVGIELLSLEALKTLPSSTVELAPGLVSTIGRCPSSETALAALIGFVRTLGLGARAVDVSSEEQLEFLRGLECDEATGPLLAPLMKADDIERLTSFRPCFERLERESLLSPAPMQVH